MKKDRTLTNCTPAATQHAALCYRQGKGGEPEILLITSRDTGRWVLPKGWPKKGESGAESAAREAHEEAGVVAKMVGNCAGLYAYDKALAQGEKVPCCVAVHILEVSHLETAYPEAGLRRREWFPPTDAAEVVAEPELSAILKGFSPSQFANGPSAKP